MTELVEEPDSSITFAVLVIVRLRFFVWIDASATVFARGRNFQRARIDRVRLIYANGWVLGTGFDK